MWTLALTGFFLQSKFYLLCDFSNKVLSLSFVILIAISDMQIFRGHPWAWREASDQQHVAL
jgi:hypothetical protein